MNCPGASPYPPMARQKVPPWVFRVDREAGGAQQLALPAALGADAAPVAQGRSGVPHGDTAVAAVGDEERRAVQREPLRAVQLGLSAAEAAARLDDLHARLDDLELVQSAVEAARRKEVPPVARQAARPHPWGRLDLGERHARSRAEDPDVFAHRGHDE
eukprot:scaffold77814_cov67-Phaeocystis_antarctica.AAC.5